MHCIRTSVDRCSRQKQFPAEIYRKKLWKNNSDGYYYNRMNYIHETEAENVCMVTDINTYNQSNDSVTKLSDIKKKVFRLLDMSFLCIEDGNRTHFFVQNCVYIYSKKYQRRA
jgi:hypothetical protein